MERHLSKAVLDGLTRRARSFMTAHSIRIDVPPVGRLAEQWLALGVPPVEINRVKEYQERWGGLVLPPAPHYDGGPRYLDSDLPEGSPNEGWLYPAGTDRTATPYSFMIGPGGEFGVYGYRWTPLHRTVEGWVESVALAHHASMWAQQVTRVTGDRVDEIALDGFEPVAEVKGMTDNWWRGNDSLVALYAGEAESLSAPSCRTMLIYSGLDDWGLYGGVRSPGHRHAKGSVNTP
ncbi:hypothetical protein [Streptomyces canus]|uniref:hypothetical protein n=1 Tax=Streptomyces canus TaxID=58343 RepID=UPI002E2ADF50|nr:hypothetical protein [Streptomyces canus]